MSDHMRIDSRQIGPGEPVYIIAEMSANHNQDFDYAVRIIHAAKEAGADAVKLQTYTPDILTIDCDNEYFRIGKGTQWEGRTLYELYSEAYTPWEWQPKLKTIADEIGITLFSTPFDATSVDFLEEMGVPAYKIASFELVDIPLIKKVAETGKPMIMSTGMATEEEIREAIEAARGAGCSELAFLKCTSAYPARPEDMNLRTIADMREKYDVPVGLSDHTLGNVASVAAVALGACIVEKHFTLSRSHKGPDSAFSLEPAEFKNMVLHIREAEKTLGIINYQAAEHEMASKIFRRSLFVVENISRGDLFSYANVRSVRPGYGLHPRYLNDIIGKRAKVDLARGVPLLWGHVEGCACTSK